MANNDLYSKVKQWDNRAAQWMGRHFYIILFEVYPGHYLPVCLYQCLEDP